MIRSCQDPELVQGAAGSQRLGVPVVGLIQLS